MNAEETSTGKKLDYWEFFAQDAARTLGTQLYARLSSGVGGDAVLREFASHVKKGQPKANILLGAVHLLLLRGAEHPLRKFYATCAARCARKTRIRFRRSATSSRSTRTKLRR